MPTFRSAVVEAAGQTAPGTISGQVKLTTRIRGTALPTPMYPTRTIGRQATPSIPEIRNVVVYLKGVTYRGTLPPARAELRQQDETFVPHLVAIGTGSFVDFPNGDPFFHNVFSLSGAATFDLGRYRQGETRGFRFNKPGLVKVFCQFNTGGPRVLAVASTYPLGVVASLSGRRWDARVATVESTPTRIRAFGGATKPLATGVIEAGAGFTPTVGLRVGVSMAHGAHLKSAEILQPNSDDRSVTMFGVEGEYAFGYTKLSGEWIRDRFETSSTPVDAHTWFIQGMHAMSPRWYVAGRREAVYAPARHPGRATGSQFR